MRFLSLVVFLISTTLLAADNPFLGTWKLNTAKSKSSPTPVAQSMTVKFEADGESVRRTVTGLDGQGKPIMQGGPKGSSIPWDGKDHGVEVPGEPGVPGGGKERVQTGHTVREPRDQGILVVQMGPGGVHGRV